MAMNRTITKDKIEQTFDLEKLLGKTPSKRQKEVFFELAVDKMVDRTTGGNDVNNIKFPDYNEDYADFKGVSVSSVDLVLSGDMLNSIESDNQNMLTISIDEDETGKAHGNITGSYGKPAPVPEKARDFFGFVNERDIESIVNIVKELPSGQEAGDVVDLADLRAAVEDVFIDFGDIE